MWTPHWPKRKFAQIFIYTDNWKITQGPNWQKYLIFATRSCTLEDLKKIYGLYESIVSYFNKKTCWSTYLYNKFRLLVHTDLLNPLVFRICCKWSNLYAKLYRLPASIQQWTPKNEVHSVRILQFFVQKTETVFSIKLKTTLW